MHEFCPLFRNVQRDRGCDGDAATANARDSVRVNASCDLRPASLLLASARLGAAKDASKCTTSSKCAVFGRSRVRSGAAATRPVRCSHVCFLFTRFEQLKNQFPNLSHQKPWKRDREDRKLERFR